MTESEKRIKAMKLFGDPKFFIESFLKVQKKSGEIVPFILKPAQIDFLNLLRSGKKRLICLKARQMGFSTLIIAYALHYALMHPGSRIAFIAYGQELTFDFLERIKLFIELLPDSIRPEVAVNSKRELVFTKLKSKIKVFPSTETVGRGYTFNFVLCSEIAFWEKAEEKMSSVLAAASEGIVVLESTPNVVGNYFHKIWVNDSGFEKRAYYWHWEYNQEQVDEIRRSMQDDEKFDREFNLAFSNTGLSVFPQQVIRRMRLSQLMVGDEVVLRNGEKFRVKSESTGVFDEKGTELVGEWTIYRPPEPSGLYVMGVDTCEGVKGGDDAVIMILDRMTGEEVASYGEKIAPDKLAIIADKKGKEYNNALLAVEINNTGISTVLKLKELMYENLFYRNGKYDIPGMEVLGRLGWRTTTATRPILIQDLVKSCGDGSIIFRSKKMCDQAEVLVYNENTMRPESPSGFHDDFVFAGGIAIQAFNNLWIGPLDQIDLDSLPASRFH